MERRIGEFINPATGEKDWLEPSTIEKLGPILSPSNVTRVGDDYMSLIEFDLKSNETEKMIELYAKYIYKEKEFISEPVKIDELEFANILADVIYSSKLLDQNESIINAKKQATGKLNDILLDNNIVLNDLYFEGIGFIIANGKKVMTTDAYKFTSSQSIVYEIELKNCTGQVSLNNLIEPKIVFYTPKYKIESNIQKVTESKEGIIKFYKVEADNIDISQNTEKIDYIKYDNLDETNEDEIESFIENRTSLLDLEKTRNEVNLDGFDFDFD